MSHHVTKHTGAKETVQVVPCVEGVRITRFVEFHGTTRLASEIVMLTWEQAAHVRDALSTYAIESMSTKEVES